MQEAFGSTVTAMVTPFTPDGAVNLDGAAALAAHLVDIGNNGLVVNGTTGEASTTTDDEKESVLRAVIGAVGDRARVIAGVGTNNTAHSVELAGRAAAAGAHALLVVTPYYNRPPQEGIRAHFRAVADATDLPNMIYDIPGRSAAEVTTQSLIELSAHPNIAAVKDAKADLSASAHVLAATDLLYYSGDDGLNLPLLSIGGSGFVSVTGHFMAGTLNDMSAAFHAGDHERARQLFYSTLPPTDAIFTTQAAMTVKGALNRRGIPTGPVRLPLVTADNDQVDALLDALEVAGV